LTKLPVRTHFGPEETPEMVQDVAEKDRVTKKLQAIALMEQVHAKKAHKILNRDNIVAVE
jgi:hypothetical protein